MCDIYERINIKTYIASIKTCLQRIAFGGKYLPVTDQSKPCHFLHGFYLVAQIGIKEVIPTCILQVTISLEWLSQDD